MVVLFIMLFTMTKQNMYLSIIKGTVQWELSWVKIGVNRSIMIFSFADKCHLPCPKGHHHESFINVVSGIITF